MYTEIGYEVRFSTVGFHNISGWFPGNSLSAKRYEIQNEAVKCFKQSQTDSLNAVTQCFLKKNLIKSFKTSHMFVICIEVNSSQQCLPFDKSLVSHTGVRSENIVQNRAFLCFLICDFDQFCAQFLYVNQIHNPRCENCAFPIKIMRDFII